MKVKKITDRDTRGFQSHGSRQRGFGFKLRQEEPLNINELSGRLFGGKMPGRLSGLASCFLRFLHRGGYAEHDQCPLSALLWRGRDGTYDPSSRRKKNELLKITARKELIS
jgi:hypothetical protein